VQADGSLLFRTQTSPNSTDWTGWQTSPNMPGWYSVSAERYGPDDAQRIELIGLQKNQSIWHRTQTTTDGGFTTWRQLDGLLTASAIARNTNGKLELFGINAQGQAWYQQQTPASQPTFTGWTPFDLPGVKLRTITAELNANDRAEAFALNATGDIFHRWQDGAGSSTYQPWVQLDGNLTSLAAGRNTDGSIVLFGINNAVSPPFTGQFRFRRSAPGVNNWSAWSSESLPDRVGTLRSMAVETNADGRIEIFAVNTSGFLWHRWQTTAGADTYSEWIPLKTDDIQLRP
jgi:hypothetical protein